jgi:hypothetical protein
MSIPFFHPNPSSFLKSLSRIKNPFSKKLILRVNVPFQTKSEGPIFVFLTVPMRKTYPFTSLHSLSSPKEKLWERLLSSPLVISIPSRGGL